MLQISPNLSLPVEAVTQTFGILAMRGAGKSNAAVVVAEEMFRAGLHWVAIDPKGDWFGIRSSGDGTKPGLAVPIFGGQHGDLPLEPGAGESLAEMIVHERLTCVIDLSEFTEGEKIRFLAGHGPKDGFAARFYKLKQTSQPPTHIFMEEADDYLPQKGFGEKGKLLHDCSRLLLWGRQRGIGGTVISQRSARIHKDVLTQSETLIVLRTTAPQDHKAIHEWVKYHGQSEELIQSLPSLENGEAWVWSPHWLSVMQKVRFRRRSTFDSGATPIVGGKLAPRAATLADVDLGAIRDKMAASIERAKADDPRELRKEIQRLKTEAVKRQRAVAPVVALAAIECARQEGASLVLRAARSLQAFVERIAVQVAQAEQAGVALQGAFQGFLREAKIAAPVKAPTQTAPHPITSNKTKFVAATDDGLPSGERSVLTAIAQYGNGVSRDQLSVLTGYKQSTRNTYIQRLGERGYVSVQGDRVAATPQGVSSLGDDFEPLPTGAALRTHWLERLPEGEAIILGVLIKAYPDALDRESLDNKTEYKRSTRNTYLQRLTARRLVESVGSGAVRASDDLF